MKKPLVAIIGRPNVGKSTLFNRIVGRRISIVKDFEGVTRDRLYCDAIWSGYNFTLIDTGGLDIKNQDNMWKHIKAQAEIAVEIADCIIFVVDGKAGVTANDIDVASYLRKSGKPVVVAVNKLDNNELNLIIDFFELGIGNVIGVSAEQAMGVGDLLDEVIAELPKVEETENSDVLNIAIVGRPNAGKSSITNKILGYDRVIVSEIAGTTRDAIDTAFEWSGQKFNIIDTAGMRKKSSIDDDIEQYSVMRALEAVRRADVVLVVFDADEEITEQDIRIAGFVHEEGKPSVIVMNKWDLVEKDTNTIYEYNKKLEEKLKFMDYFVPLYCSAKSGQRIEKLLMLAVEVFSESSRRITTGVLNDIVQDSIIAVEPPSHNGKRFKIYFVTQAVTNPPTFIFFVNDIELIHFSYKRYLENSLRKSFEFKGTPIRLVFRNRKEDEPIAQ